MQKLTVLEIKIAFNDSLKTYKAKCCAVELLQKDSSRALSHSVPRRGLCFREGRLKTWKLIVPVLRTKNKVTNPVPGFSALK